MTALSLPMNELLPLAVALIGAGIAVGLLSGMLGVGGGGVLVPALYETFGFIGVDPGIRMQMSVGTSLAVIGITSWRTFSAHRARGSVDMTVLKRLAPWYVLGVLCGIVLARYTGGTLLKWAWVVFGGLMATKLAFGRDSWRLGDDLPGSWIVEFYAALVGLISVLLSIAGAAYMVTLMTLYGRPILQAVGTSSGFGPLVSLPGVIGFIWAGWNVGSTPPGSLGFVNLVGAAIILPASLLFAPVGVRLAHGVSKRTLELAFAVFLYLVVLRFLASLVGWTT